MSTKTSIKRIALVAVAALGFGMVSTVPSNAAAAAVTALTVEKAASPADSSLFIATATGSALSLSYNVYTSNSSVSVSDIAAKITSAGDTTTGFRKITWAAGTTTTLRATAATAFGRTAALTTATATALVDATGTSAPTTFTASSTGTSYVLWNDGIKAADGTASADGVDQKPGTDEALVTLTFYKTTSTSSIAVTSATSSVAAPVVGINGQAGHYTVTYTTPYSTDTVNSSFRITAAPTGSKLLSNPLNHYYTAAGTKTLLSSSTMQNGSAYFAGMTSTTDSVAAAAVQTAPSSLAVAKDFYFWPDVAGTYTFTFFDDRNNNGLVDGSDVSSQFSLTLGASASSFTVSNLSGLAPTTATNPNSTEYGAIIRVKALDSAGAATAPAADGGITVSISGSAKIAYKNNVATASVSTLTLGSADFDASGYAYLNVIDATAETVTISVSGTGSLANAATVTTTARYVAASAGIQLVPGAGGTAGTSGTGFVATSATDYKIPAAASITWESVLAASASTATTTKYGAIQVTDTAKKIFGSTIALSYDSAVATDTSGNADFTITTTKATAGAAYDLIGQTTVGSATSTITATVQVPAITSTTIAFTPASGVRSALLGSNTVVAKVVDQFGNAVPNATVTWSVSGRNTSTTSPVVVTDASGKASFTLTDAAASTATALNDTVTASVSYTDAAGTTTTTSGTWSVNYSNVAIKTVALDSDNYTAGVANLAVSPQGVIQAGKAGASASAGRKTITATVTDTNGAAVSGQACAWSVAGTGAAILSTTKTTYTNALGACTTSVYAWIAGTYTITATAGGISGTATETFYNADPASVRTVSATVDGNTVTAVAKDRFGNTVAGATLYAIASGGANIGGSLISSTPVTNKNGEVSWVITGTGSVKVTTVNPAGNGLDLVTQATAAKGYVNGDVATPVAFTATTVGTTTTAETGVGASYDAAGVSSVTVDVTTVGNSDSVDAANEATDAANAATDAANAAAEAADAATAAAQDAQAAVAALATQVASLIAGIKAQITTLTNLVIKIQKKVRA